MVDTVVKLKDLKQDPHNARRHSPRGLETLVRALHEVGAARSGVIDEKGRILAGNLTYEALAEAGIERVRVVETDGKEWVVVKRSGLTEEQKKKLALYDNRVAEFSDWDPVVLAGIAANEAGLLDGLFYDDELAQLLGDLLAEDPPEDPGPQIDRAAELQEKWGVEPGQLWRIPSRSVPTGEHRIICGDCTDPEVVERVMAGERADLALADPPYGVGIDYGPNTEDTREQTKRLAQATIPLLTDLAPMVFWVSGGIILLGFYYRSLPPDWLVVWYKGSPGHRSFVGFNDWEAILVYGKRSGVQMHDFLDVRPSEAKGAYGHPVPKPVEWAQWFIERATEPECTVLDPFLGSGTTIVACERLGRLGRGVEIEPKYCAVALERMAGMGLDPHLADR